MIVRTLWHWAWSIAVGFGVAFVAAFMLHVAWLWLTHQMGWQ